ncbi:MAG: hypothetical protein J0L92_09800 [Deltaproteobacteria bacterium]|nr:hypothetical protein [Deltaproteobacteria bacterium]
MTKHESILALIARLDLPSRGWAVMDHWEADLCALGVTSAAHPGRLVYVSTFRFGPDRYHYALELPPRDPNDVYLPAGEGDDVTFEELLDVMIEHLDG